jgi:hypothetical protein
VKRLLAIEGTITFLIERLQHIMESQQAVTQETAFRAGSNAKHTSLRSTNLSKFDVDLGLYFHERKATEEELDMLLRFVREQLIKIYPPNKCSEDFTIEGSAVRIRFRTRRLYVDIVPIIRDPSLGIENGGQIPRHDGRRLTSITCHTDFVRRRTECSKRVSGSVSFNKLVRLVKWWNNRQGELRQSSYFCELITAAALEKEEVTSDWQSSLYRIFSFLCTHQLQKPIIFYDYYKSRSIQLPSDPVIVLDTVDPTNNITHKWDEGKRRGYIRRVQQTYKMMMQAQNYERSGKEEEAVKIWCQIFGEASKLRTQWKGRRGSENLVPNFWRRVSELWGIILYAKAIFTPEYTPFSFFDAIALNDPCLSSTQYFTTIRSVTAQSTISWTNVDRATLSRLYLNRL